MQANHGRLMARDRPELPPLPIQYTTPVTIPRALAFAITNPLKRKFVGEEPDPRINKSLPFHRSDHSDMETYHGHVRTPADAIVLFEACRLGLLPRVQRRLSEKERQSIKSGSVFVWDEREAGMRRWTDGKSWSASRVSGSFLTYREMEGKRGGGGNGFTPQVAVLSRAGRTPESTHGSESEIDANSEEGPDGYRYKADGLVKQSFSITTSAGNHLHLISYFSRTDPMSPQLKYPSTDPQLHHIRPAKGMYPDSTVHEHQNIPAVTRSPMAGAPYSTTPQMAGYARQGPPQWPQQPYAWPATPPTQAQYSQYYGYQYPNANGQPPNNGASQAYPPQPAQYSSSQPPDRNHQTHEARSAPPPAPYPSFDSRRYPPTPPDSQSGPRQSPLEPADPRTQHPAHASYPPPVHYANATREAYPQSHMDPRYQNAPPSGKESTYSPQRAQGPLSHLAPQQAPPGQGWSSSILPPPPHDRSPGVAHPTPQGRVQPLTPIDPALMGPPGGGPQLRDHHPSEYQRAPAAPPRQDAPLGHSSPLNGYPSAASSIPSIGALVKGTSAEVQRLNPPTSMPATTQAPPNGYSSFAPTVEKPGSAENSQNGEDKRAKGLLDRGFKV